MPTLRSTAQVVTGEKTTASVHGRQRVRSRQVRVRSIHRDAASALGRSTVRALNTQEALVPPRWAPGVLDLPVHGAGISAVADSEHTVVKLVAACLARLDDSLLVELEHLRACVRASVRA